MEYNSESIGYDTYLDLLEAVNALKEIAKKSLDRGELKAGREYRRKLRQLSDIIKATRSESLKRSSRNSKSF
jgi:hypothetical protein